jgi:fructuronate reductase
MKLSVKNILERQIWEKAGFILPKYDIEKTNRETLKNPTWIHFGAGNIFRAFPCAVLQKALDAGKADRGIIVCEGFDYEIIDKAYAPFDNLSVLVTLKADGTIEKKVISTVSAAYKGDPSFASDWAAIQNAFKAPSLQMVSFTITEKGYSLVTAKGEFLPDVTADIEAGPICPKSTIGKLTSLCYERYMAGAYPISLVSMDNCSHNGQRLYDAVSQITKAWVDNKKVDTGFYDYISNPKKVGFPWSMIDKITPRPDEGVQKMLSESGFEDTQTIITNRNTYTAAFVNAEQAEYLVIEDLFPNGRPALDFGGVIFTDRETVNNVETMKVCTCLNPLHTVLAVYGCLLGYKKIHEEMADSLLSKFVDIVGYREGLPVVVDPKILSPKKFIDEVLGIRFPNPFMPDTPQRIATDTSQKLGIRFGGTIKAYATDPNRSVTDLKLIPLVLAGWCRYLMGIDDNGNPFELSPDPLLGDVCPHVADIKLGDTQIGDKLRPILSDARIFAVDLYQVGLGEMVENYFLELIAGVGAIRATLDKYVK